jgi:hypothetical protein
MKSYKSARSRAAANHARNLIRALLLGFFALDRHAWAQQILAPAPIMPDQTPLAMQQTSEMDVFATPPPTESQPFKWGAFTLRPHPYYQFLYADGLQYSPGLAATTLIHNISPGILLEMGRHWTLDYTPVVSIFSNDRFSNTFGQAASLTGGTVYNDWVLELNQSYSVTNLPSVVTASQTRQETFDTALTGSYTINSKMSLDLGLNQNFVSADEFSSYREWSTTDWLNYEFWPRLSAAAGVGGGYDDNRDGPDAAFERIQGRINWRATERISFQLHGGVEVRQFLSGDAQNLVNPIFDATIQYRPFEMTHISLTGQHVVYASYLQGQVTETTSVGLELMQRLPERFFLGLNGSYQFVNYISSVAPSGSDRQDNYYYLNVQLGRTFLRRGSIAVIYQFSRNISSTSGYSFISQQVGFQIGYTY